MTYRRALQVSLALAAVTATVSTNAAEAAKPRPLPTTCKLLTDPTGDGGARVFPMNARPTDVVEVDIASGSKTVKVTLKTSTLDVNSDPQTMSGATWAVNWEIGSTPYAVVYSVGMQGQGGSGSLLVDRNRVDGASPTITFDTAKSTITWVVDRKHLPSLKKVGQKYIRIGMSTQVNFGTWFGADAGTSEKTYTDKQPSCLKPA